MHLFDSNILIYHLNDALPPDVLTQVEAWIAAGALMSAMTRIEVSGYPQSAEQFQQATRLLAFFEEVPLEEAIVQRTSTLRNNIGYDSKIL